MTFGDYYSQIALSVFPEGEAENLVGVHKNAVRDALIDLQIKVPCLRTDHADYIGQSSTTFHCGASVFDGVDGGIERVYTIDLCNACDIVEYKYIDPARMQDLMRQYKCCIPYTAYGMSPHPAGGCVPGAPVYPVGDSTMDKGCRAGSHEAFWTVQHGQITVFPSIESTEQIVVEWTGTRRTWVDSTTMPETMVDGVAPNETLNREVAVAVEAYLSAEVDRRETKDMSSFNLNSKLYSDNVAQLIWECRRKTNPIRTVKAMSPDVGSGTSCKSSGPCGCGGVVT